MIAAALYLIASVTVQQPPAPLRIVVLAGEDSINVIQQKSAVAPLVEVRDRNNNPVAGALVRFAVQGGKSASFQGGVSTISVATNAAGQAAATGFMPLTAGAVNISVEAAFQGQIATAAISQVNVLTAAEAAAAAGGAGASGGAGGSTAGGAAGGGAAGGGGGLSATTIGIVGGAVAAGAVAGTQLIGQSSIYEGPFSMPWTAVFGSCARQETWAGRLEFDICIDGGSISGRANISEGSTVVTATTCAGPLGVGSRQLWGGAQATVTGSESNITFQANDTIQNLEGVSTNRVFTFQGAMSGDSITGRFTMTWTVPQLNSPGLVLSADVTLRKR